MVQFSLTIVLIIGVLQVCTANPISSEEDAGKLFSADELQRAKNAGLPERRLVEGKSYGFTFEEMIKFQELRNSYPDKRATAEFAVKACEILSPEQKMPTSYKSDQETQIQKLPVKLQHLLIDKHEIHDFLRSTVCTYVSQPDLFDMEAESFGLPLVDYMGNRYLKMKAQKVTGVERVIVAKQMCCVRESQRENDENTIVSLHLSKFTGLPDGEWNGFDEHWKQYETANTLKSFENVCDYITKDQTEDECITGVPDDAATMAANE